MDRWKHRSKEMSCSKCMFYVAKVDEKNALTGLGRCRQHAPTLKGWPAVFEDDWCGDHKLDERKVNVAQA